MRIILFILTIVTLVACKKERRRPVYYAEMPSTEVASSPEPEAKAEPEADKVIIPYREKNGVKYVDVKVNGVAFEMILDTGCSSTLISLAEASYLYLKGQLSIDDFQGMSRSKIADGSVTEDMVVKLREVTIADKVVCPDVIATVSINLHAPLLLGNEVLDRVATITIDNEKKELQLKLKQHE